MDIQIIVRLHYAVPQPADLLIQLEAANDAHQTIAREKLIIDDQASWRSVTGEDGIGKRFWLSAKDYFQCSYEAEVAVSRVGQPLVTLSQTPVLELPDGVTQYLMSSRYCHLEQFLDFTSHEFNGPEGGELIACMSDWIHRNITYTPGASGAQTTAHHTFSNRAGVCRDFAHVLIAMARAVGIPARIVSAYAPNVRPQDFHAVAEVFLEGNWHLVDPTGMSTPEDIVRIGVGRDAVDISFLTSYGDVILREQLVKVSVI